MNEKHVAAMVALDFVAKSEKQKEYQEFFKKKLKEHGVDSPADLSDDEKKKFFDEIDKEWKSEDEKE
jgi:hypothetical protein